MLRTFTFAMLLTTHVGSVAFADSATDQVLDRVFTSYGGASLIASDNTLYETGTTYSYARQIHGPVTRSYRHPNQMRIEISYPDGAETRILNGATASNNGKPANTPFYMATLLQAARLTLPRLLLENRDKVSLSGTTQSGLLTLTLPLATGLDVIAEVDPDNGHIVRSEGRGSYNGMPLRFATEYKNFQHIEGRLVAMYEQHYAMGNAIGHTELNQVSFNRELPAALFIPQTGSGI